MSCSLKTATKEIGDKGEDIAAKYLQEKGYTLLQRNYRLRIGEIDLIAEKQGVLVFCEVKRSRFQGQSHPELRVNHDKQVKLARCAQAFIADRSPSFESCRFDVIAVKTQRGRNVVEHFENAFWPPDGWDEE